MLIDPGHGGSDVGATYGTIFEKDIALAYALTLGDIAKKSGKTVRYTRNKDKTVHLNTRSKEVKPGEILISCHVNSVASVEPNGLSVWYHGGGKESYKLAVEVFQSIMATNLFKKYGAGVISDLKLYRTGFAVLRKAEEIGARAAILIEPGFIRNKNDRAVLTNPAKRIILAKAINDGVNDYLNLAKKNA